MAEEIMRTTDILKDYRCGVGRSHEPFIIEKFVSAIESRTSGSSESACREEFDFKRWRNSSLRILTRASDGVVVLPDINSLTRPSVIGDEPSEFNIQLPRESLWQMKCRLIEMATALLIWLGGDGSAHQWETRTLWRSMALRVCPLGTGGNFRVKISRNFKSSHTQEHICEYIIFNVCRFSRPTWAVAGVHYSSLMLVSNIKSVVFWSVSVYSNSRLLCKRSHQITSVAKNGISWLF